MNKIEKVLKTYGTPTYIYDIDILKSRVSYLKEKFGSKYELVYAVKANTFIAKHLEELVQRYEICSPGEYHICKKLNISPQKMVISGVYKDQETMEEMLLEETDILKYTIESLNQYHLLDALTKKYQKKIHLLIRLTSGNQFGIEKEELLELLENHHSPWMMIDGIEYFSGTQKHSIHRIEKEVTLLLDLLEEIKKRGISIKEIEYGLGLPVFYYQGEEFLEDEFLTQVKQELDRIPIKVTLELGRSIAASCGFYLTKVVDMKENRYGKFAILDGGIHHLVYYGQTMAMKIPYYEILPQREDTEETYQLCGSLCTINDFLVKNIRTRTLHLGDVFVFQKVGAYSATEGISLFLSRDLPKVVLVQKNQMILARNTIQTSDINFPNNVVEE